MQSTRTASQLIVGIVVLCGFVSAEDWNVQFFPKEVECFMGRSVQVNVTIKSTESAVSDYVFVSEFSKLAEVNKNISSEEFNLQRLKWKGGLEIDCRLLGMSEIYVEHGGVKSHNTLKLIIVKEMKLIDKLFSATIALVITFLYINFGAALDLEVLKGILKKPVGPCIGFFCQYVLMPLLGFILGYIVFPDQVHFRLGLFFTAVSPGGGMSNIFTVVLNGNINLSIAMTTISNIAALWMMPLWIFTLGAVIFEDFNFDVPYLTIVVFCCSMVIPLCIGMAVQKYLPSVSKVLVRILKPASIILMLSIVTFAVWLDFYIFQLFTWQIILAGMGLPWTGYLITWSIAKILRQSNKDALTIAIEAGIQNIGIAFFLLRFSLPQPYQDITTLIPVSISFMTPLPLIVLLILKKIFKVFQTEEVDTIVPERNVKEKEMEVMIKA